EPAVLSLLVLHRPAKAARRVSSKPFSGAFSGASADEDEMISHDSAGRQVRHFDPELPAVGEQDETVRCGHLKHGPGITLTIRPEELNGYARDQGGRIPRSALSLLSVCRLRLLRIPASVRLLSVRRYRMRVEEGCLHGILLRSRPGCGGSYLDRAR